MKRKIFITATDTHAGKTYTSTGLLRAAHMRNMTTIGMKPIATGCEYQQGRLVNPDAASLQLASSYKLDYNIINPFAFRPATAPHIAAKKANILLSAAELASHIQHVFSFPADLYLIEGFGGWYAPLNDEETIADFVKHLDCEVIFVVGVRLGCLNHAILTEQAILSSNVHCIGWIACHVDEHMLYQDEHIETLNQRLKTPMLARIPYGADASRILVHSTIF